MLKREAKQPQLTTPSPDNNNSPAQESISTYSSSLTSAFDSNYVAPNVIRRAKTSPASLTPANILALQRTVGNKTVQRLIAKHSTRLAPHRDFKNQPTTSSSQAQSNKSSSEFSSITTTSIEPLQDHKVLQREADIVGTDHDLYLPTQNTVHPDIVDFYTSEFKAGRMDPGAAFVKVNKDSEDDYLDDGHHNYVAAYKADKENELDMHDSGIKPVTTEHSDWSEVRYERFEIIDHGSFDKWLKNGDHIHHQRRADLIEAINDSDEGAMRTALEEWRKWELQLLQNKDEGTQTDIWGPAENNQVDDSLTDLIGEFIDDAPDVSNSDEDEANQPENEDEASQPENEDEADQPENVMEQDLPMEFIMPTIKLYPPANIAIGRGYSFGRTTIRLINPDKIFSGKIQVQVLEKSEKDDLPLGNYWMHKKDLKNGQAL